MGGVKGTRERKERTHSEESVVLRTVVGGDEEVSGGDGAGHGGAPY